MNNIMNAISFAEMNKDKKNCFISSSAKKLNNSTEELQNSITDAGYDVDITTLTQIKAKIVKEKFYEVPISDFIPVKVGNGAWMEQLLTWKEESQAGNFESGIINQATNNSRIARVDSSIEAIKTKIVSWAKSIQYNLIEIRSASKVGNWSKIESLERSRKKNYDLGIQEIAFLGIDSDSGVNGLLTNPNVNVNTSTITKSISSMTTTEFQDFLSKLLKDYSINSNSTVLPDTFIIPLTDWLGMGVASSPQFPIDTKIGYLERVFKQITGNDKAKMKYLSYCDSARNNLGKQRYVLYNSNEDVLGMDVPVPYTTTAIGSLNGFAFQNISYAQFTGVEVYRPLEMLYFDY